MKKRLHFCPFFLTLLFVAFNTIQAQTNGHENTADVFRRYEFEVWQKLDSIKTSTRKEIADFQKNLQNMEVEVAQGGKMVVQGDTVDVATPMKGIIDGVEEIGKAFGLPDASLDPLRESAEDMPYYLKAGLDFLKGIDLGWGTQEEDK
ncbi:hypothetical protein C7N43_33860 [Sphingobacteriales bacterium UPWRP_1]|nr:hypothetical protein C7N43_33860 [Sphingobacteriales bacterium UPWRP_1]